MKEFCLKYYSVFFDFLSCSVIIRKFQREIKGSIKDSLRIMKCKNIELSQMSKSAKIWIKKKKKQTKNPTKTKILIERPIESIGIEFSWNFEQK